jgi:hypothetical protein
MSILKAGTKRNDDGATVHIDKTNSIGGDVGFHSHQFVNSRKPSVYGLFRMVLHLHKAAQRCRGFFRPSAPKGKAK